MRLALALCYKAYEYLTGGADWRFKDALLSERFIRLNDEELNCTL